MANPNIYNDALNKFRAEYNLPDYDLEKEIAADNVTRFFNNKSIGASAQQYERLAANAALKYFESSTTFQKTGTKQLKGFDHSKFIADFEALMQARYDSKLEDGVEAEKRTPFDGSDKEKLKIAINASANKVNKPLAELWADKLISGTYKFKDLNSIVAVQSNTLFAAKEKTEENVRIFRDLVASREAVRELRASRKGIRGFFWRLFNREQNKQEKDLLASLDSQINQLGELKGYDVNSALHDATNITTWGKDLFERSNAVDLSIDKREPEKFPINEEEEKENLKNIRLDSDRVKEWEQIQAENQRKIEELSVPIEQDEPSKAFKLARSLEDKPPVENSENSEKAFSNWFEKREATLKSSIKEQLEEIAYPLIEDKNNMKLAQVENIQKLYQSMALPFNYICEDAQNPNMTPEEFHKSVHQHLSSAFGIIIGRLNNISRESGEEVDIKQNFVNAAKIFEMGFKAYAPKEAFPEGSYEKYANDYILNLDIVGDHFDKYADSFDSKDDLAGFIESVKETLQEDREADKQSLIDEQKKMDDQYAKEQARLKALIAEEKRQKEQAEQRKIEDAKLLQEKADRELQKQIEERRLQREAQEEQERIQQEMEKLKEELNLQGVQANAEKALDLELQLKESEINAKFAFLNSEDPKEIPEGKTLANKNILKLGYIPRMENLKKDRENINKILDYLKDFKQPDGMMPIGDYVNSKGETMDAFTHYVLSTVTNLSNTKISFVEKIAADHERRLKLCNKESEKIELAVEEKQRIKNEFDKYWSDGANNIVLDFNKFRNDRAQRKYDSTLHKIFAMDEKELFVDSQLLKERADKYYKELLEEKTQQFKENGQEMLNSDIADVKASAKQIARRELRSEKRQQLREEATELYNNKDKEFFPEIKIPNLLLPEEKKVELNQQESIVADDRKEFINKLGEDVNGKDVSNKSEKVETKDNPTLETVKE